MKKLTIILCILYLSQLLSAQIDPTLSSELQNVLDNSVAVSGNHGVSAALIMPNGDIWNGTAGIGKDELPITDSTLFHGASTTKFNIALLMLLLAEDGLVDLDQPWSSYISLNVAFDPSITVRQLLNNTSGIADYLETGTSEDEITSDFNHFYTPQYILENIVSSTPVFPAGTDFQYSNSNYVLAGLIAATVTGNPVQTELRNRIWNPLGMNHTYFGAYDTYTEPTAGVWWDFGTGLSNCTNEPTTSMLSFAYGAGNIVTCPSDLALLLNSVINGQLLSSQSMDEMLTFIPESYSSWTAGYGLGIHHVYGLYTDTAIGHDGYFTNMTDMFHSMNYDFTLVTMTNTKTEWFGIFNPMYDIVVEYMNSTTSDDNKQRPENELNIYPNPAHNKLNIASTNYEKDVTITISDVNGAIRISMSLSEISSNGIDIKGLEAGVYFITLVDKKSKVRSIKFIKE
jgi:D-alanyl-D-alanine carboxypeptidase